MPQFKGWFWARCGAWAWIAGACAAIPAHAQFFYGAEQHGKAGGADIVVPGYSVPSFVDWNNDGLKDLVVGEGGGSHPGKVRVYLNVGTQNAPRFQDCFYVQANAADLTVPSSFCLGAFPRVVYWDADARKDLLIGLADGRVKIYLNVATDEAPQFDVGTYLTVGPPGGKIDIDVGLRATPTVADWNIDGKKDLIVGAYDGRIHVFINEGTDTCPNFITEAFAQDSGADLVVEDVRSSPHLLDLTGDGKQDLLSGNTEGELVLYANVGQNDAPVFAGYSLLQADGDVIDLDADARSRPFVCDWTDNGLPDLLVGAGDGKIHLYRALPAGDIDGDADVDHDDLAAFVDVLLGHPLRSVYASRSDLNKDGIVNGLDIAPFINALLPP